MLPESRVFAESQMPLEWIIGGEEVDRRSPAWDLCVNSDEPLWPDHRGGAVVRLVPETVADRAVKASHGVT